MCACRGPGDVSGGSTFVAGQLSQKSEAVTHTPSHTHGGGGKEFPRGMAAFMCPRLHWHRCRGKESQVSHDSTRRGKVSSTGREHRPCSQTTLDPTPRLPPLGTGHGKLVGFSKLVSFSDYRDNFGDRPCFPGYL